MLMCVIIFYLNKNINQKLQPVNESKTKQCTQLDQPQMFKMSQGRIVKTEDSGLKTEV